MSRTREFHFDGPGSRVDNFSTTLRSENDFRLFRAQSDGTRRAFSAFQGPRDVYFETNDECLVELLQRFTSRFSRKVQIRTDESFIFGLTSIIFRTTGRQ
ncbi:hypothetical protein MMC07_007020 [Pseudocyphellaria aurata]|nr:hypothetical protein [Pseudocyphellaria aurata]